MNGMIVDNLSYEPMSIIRHIKEKYKYTISYKKTWLAKQKVLERRFGTYEVSYDNLPRILATICARNSGSYFDIRTLSNQLGSPSILQHAFFTFGLCIFAFSHCWPMLCIDGTFLTGKYKGHILIVIGVDGNNQLLPVAYAFVESEYTDSWY